MKSNIQCPVSTNKADENVARIVAFFALAITLLGLYMNAYWLILLLAADFTLRAFTTGTYSPLKNAAKAIAAKLSLEKKTTDAEPKKFAAGLGMAFCLIIASLQISGFQLAANGVGAVLLFCAVLESGFAICLGCIVYTYMVLPFYKQSSKL